MKKLFIILSMALLIGQAFTLNKDYLMVHDDDFIDLYSDTPIMKEV